MNETERGKALKAAVEAASEAGALMRKNWNAPKRISSQQQHDIKLELDVRCQELIERNLARAFPGVSVLGEEGNTGAGESEARWVIDPIDGTVNFAYGIPHACVSIALQERRTPSGPGRVEARRGVGRARNHPDAAYDTTVGVVLDPFCGEVWTAVLGRPARLNGRIIRVSSRDRLEEAIVTVGFAKDRDTMEQMLPVLNGLVREVRKIRIMGAAALAMTYVATGRFDAYLEAGVRLWDIAAGGLILECAGGEFWREPVDGDHKYRVVANNGRIRRRLSAATKKLQSATGLSSSGA